MTFALRQFSGASAGLAVPHEHLFRTSDFRCYSTRSHTVFR